MSRDFGKVAPSFWTGETGQRIRAMGNDHQLVALYLMTGPFATMIGIYHLPPPVAAYHIANMPPKALHKVFQRLIEEDFLRVDKPNDVVFLPQAAKFQIGESLKPTDNNVKHLKRELLKWRKSKFYKEFLDIYTDRYSLHDMPPYEALGKGSIVAPEAPSKQGDGEGDVDGDGKGDREEEGASGGRKAAAASPKPYPDDFEEFWLAFPPTRKNSKVRAYEAWKVAIKLATPETIIAAAREFAPTPLANCKFCPGPEPWLSKGRWEDDRRSWQRGDDSQAKVKDPRGNFAAANEYLSMFQGDAE